jgi:hypothetical protein
MGLDSHTTGSESVGSLAGMVFEQPYKKLKGKRCTERLCVEEFVKTCVTHEYVGIFVRRDEFREF